MYLTTTIANLIMASNFETLFVMVVMIWKFCVSILVILLLSLLKVLIFVVLFVTLDRHKSIPWVSVHYHEKDCEEHEGQKCLISIDNILDKVLDKIKEITGIEKLDDFKILIDRDNRIADDFPLKNVMNLISMCY